MSRALFQACPIDRNSLKLSRANCYVKLPGGSVIYEFIIYNLAEGI